MSSNDASHAWTITALSTVPAIAFIAIVASSYLAHAPDIIAARVYGGPPGPDQQLAWRIVVSLRDRGFYEPVPNLSLTLRAEDQIIEGVTDDEGAWEARIPTPKPSADTVDVTLRRRDDDQILLSQRIPVHPPSWNASFRRTSPDLFGRQSGSLQVDVALLRSFLASSFPERALVRVHRHGQAAASASLAIESEGVEIQPVHTILTDEDGRAWISIRPMFPAPALVIEAQTASGESGRFDGVLPVRTGALWVEPKARKDGRLVIASPVRHHRAYVTLFTEHARLLGARVPLEDDGHGGAKGSVVLPALPNEPVWAMVSPDPQGTGGEPETLAWPILRHGDRSPTAAAHVSTALLADGMPRALAASRGRSHAGRLRALLILAAAAIFEAGLLGVRARHARKELEGVLSRHAEADEAVTRALLGGSRFWVRMLVAVALVAVAFSAMAFVTWMSGV